MRTLHHLLETRRYDDFRDRLAQAEIDQDISEFHALNFHAMLAIIERSSLAGDYLEMAEAAAETPYEMALISESLAAYDLSNGDALSAARRCLNTLDRIQQTEGLWSRLLTALCRLGDIDAVDKTLRGFSMIDDDCNERLIELLSAEPDLREIRTRPAFQQLLARRRAIQTQKTNNDYRAARMMPIMQRYSVEGI